jgi:hypothetical protein
MAHRFQKMDCKYSEFIGFLQGFTEGEYTLNRSATGRGEEANETRVCKAIFQQLTIPIFLITNPSD